MRNKMAVAMLGIALVGCAGRDPQPLATVQPQDAYADCTMIQAEIQANNIKVKELADEQGLKVAQNVGGRRWTSRLASLVRDGLQGRGEQGRSGAPSAPAISCSAGDRSGALGRRASRPSVRTDSAADCADHAAPKDGNGAASDLN